MHASVLLATLAATAAVATPLRERAAPTWVEAPSASYAPAPSGHATHPQDPPKQEPPKGGETGGLLGNPDAEPNLAVPEGLVADLLTQASSVTRFTEIQEQVKAGAISLKFDHNPAANPGVTPGEGGQVDLANRANFPVLTGLGISSATIFFQPCGLNTPHVHPRATEYFTLATNNNMTTGFVLENGLTDEFTVDLGIWQGTVFPQGSVHWQLNNDCEPATGVAGLNSEDPGAGSIAQNFLRFTRQDVVEASLDLPAEISGDNFAEFKDAIPLSLAQGVESCLKRCNIKY